MNTIIAIIGKLIAYIIPAWIKGKHEQKERMKEAVEIEDDPNYKSFSEGEIL